MDIFWYVIEFIMCAIEQVLIFALCYRTLGINEKYRISHVVLISAGFALLIWGITCIDVYAVWKSVLSVFLIVLYILISFSGKKKERLFHSVLIIVLMVLADVMATAFVSWVKGAITWETVLSAPVDKLVVFSIAKIIMCLIIAILIHKKQITSAVMPLRYWLLFLFSFSLMLMSVLAFVDVGFSFESDIRFNIVVICIIMVMLIFYLMVYFFYYRLCSYFTERNERNLIEYQNEMIDKYMLQKQESDKMIRILNHDLTHHLLSWKQLLEEQGYHEALESVLEYEKAHEKYKLIDVENDMGNALINQKLLAARNKDIELTVQGVFYDDITISKIDFFALLGNLLDNATEAADKVDHSDARWISMSIKRNGRFLLLEIENTFAEEPVLKNGLMISQKKNRTVHGVGMLSINHVLSKYEGNMIQTYENGIFKATVGLCVYGDLF